MTNKLCSSYKWLWLTLIIYCYIAKFLLKKEITRKLISDYATTVPSWAYIDDLPNPGGGVGYSNHPSIVRFGMLTGNLYDVTPLPTEDNPIIIDIDLKNMILTPKSDYDDYIDSFTDITESEIINSGKLYTGLQEELGSNIGDCDLTNIKYYNTPKSIWEMLGFEEEDLSEVGTPYNSRYWKNIIPKDYSIFNREGLDGDLIDTYSEQDWLDIDGDGQPDYYYPVLPKYSQNGRFIEGDFPNDKISFPLEGSITDDNESNKNLIINISNNNVENNIFYDNSGNSNFGFSFSDYKPNFDNESLQPKKVKSFDITKTSKKNRAF